MNKLVNCCLIEDNDISVFMSKRLMAKHPHFDEPLVFTNGTEAFEAFKSYLQTKQALPDVIVLDLLMPIWDGWDFLDAISDEFPDWSLPVFIITSSIDPADKKRAEKYPSVQSLLEKPLTEETLDRIASHLSKTI